MIRIALMGDLHYPFIPEGHTELHEAAKQFYSEYVHRFLDVEADWHISIGDTTHGGLEAEFKQLYQLIRRQKVNFRQVLGNHDVLELTKTTITALIDQPGYDVVETEDLLLVFLDTTIEFELHGWGLNKSQWDWLKLQVRRSIDKPMFIFAHHPVPGTTKFAPDGDLSYTAFQDIRPLLEEREGFVMYFNGHTHTHSIVRKGNHHFIQAGAVLCDPSYYIVEIDNEQVRVQTVPINDETLPSSRSLLFEQLPDYHRPEIFSDRGAQELYIALISEEKEEGN